ncbi:hypothetical protein BH10ACT7_BH10ACT7_28990 [soil metagenome]
MSRHFRPIGALTTVVVGSLLLALLGAPAAHADDYPTWDEVQAARQNQAATEATINDIEKILVDLEAQSAESGKVAQVAGEKYNEAVADLDAASARAEKLTAQADDAQRRASLSSQRAGQLVAQFARTGGGSVSLGLLLAPEAGDLLNTLGTMSRVTEQSTMIYRQALADQNLARALGDQAKVAEAERKTMAATAKSALTEAKAAADAALARVNEQQAAADTMYAQLAVLKGTTASVEADYQAGLTAEQEQQQAEPPPTPQNPPNPPPPAPNNSAVQGAIAFAYAQIGDMYQFAGSGPDRWDCSGLTKGAYASVGVYIGAHLVSSQYYTMGAQNRLVPLANMVPGDLIFYANGGSPSGGFYHVTMYVGNGQMIEAPREGIPVRVTAVRYWDILPYAGRPTP